MDYRSLYCGCVDELKKFMSSAGFSDCVIGLSGGIDSALVATMACDALGAEHVHGVLLPGPYSSQGSVDDAVELADNLGMEHVSISIEPPYSSFVETIEAATGKPLGNLACENTQARCRMVVLMALSNANGWMMLNTGNRSEAAMGYSTLYGDTAGAFAPIGGIYKSDVFALARWRNSARIEGWTVAPIPQNIIEKPPSAELSPDQTDEASLGIDYGKLDRMLEAYFDLGSTLDQIIGDDITREQIEDVISRYDAYAFKRAMEPPFPCIEGYPELLDRTMDGADEHR